MSDGRKPQSLRSNDGPGEERERNQSGDRLGSFSRRLEKTDGAAVGEVLTAPGRRGGFCARWSSRGVRQKLGSATLTDATPAASSHPERRLRGLNLVDDEGQLGLELRMKTYRIEGGPDVIFRACSPASWLLCGRVARAGAHAGLARTPRRGNRRALRTRRSSTCDRALPALYVLLDDAPPPLCRPAAGETSSRTRGRSVRGRRRGLDGRRRGACTDSSSLERKASSSGLFGCSARHGSGWPSSGGLQPMHEPS